MLEPTTVRKGDNMLASDTSRLVKSIMDLSLLVDRSTRMLPVDAITTSNDAAQAIINLLHVVGKNSINDVIYAAEKRLTEIHKA